MAARSHWKPHASALFNQLQRAALSVQTNIAEGYALGGKRFVYHLTMAYGSAVETTDLLETGLQEGILPGDVAVDSIRRSKRCQALLMGLIKRYRAS